MPGSLVRALLGSATQAQRSVFSTIAAAVARESGAVVCIAAMGPSPNQLGQTLSDMEGKLGWHRVTN